jgi:hypothetical protein
MVLLHEIQKKKHQTMASFGGRDPAIKCTQSRKTGKCMLQGYELKKIPIELLDPFNHLEL